MGTKASQTADLLTCPAAASPTCLSPWYVHFISPSLQTCSSLDLGHPTLPWFALSQAAAALSLPLTASALLPLSPSTLDHSRVSSLWSLPSSLDSPVSSHAFKQNALGSPEASKMAALLADGHHQMDIISSDHILLPALVLLILPISTSAFQHSSSQVLSCFHIVTIPKAYPSVT